MALAGTQAYVVAPADERLAKKVREIADTYRRPQRPLHLQALMQLPRVADRWGNVAQSGADALLRELAGELPQREEWTVPEQLQSPRALTFCDVAPETAVFVTERFHYLRSPRRDARSYGLFTGAGKLVALCTSSPLDVPRLTDMLERAERSPSSARVLSRVFAFEGAPKNSISYLLARAAERERRIDVRDYLTYVNPNLGFSGASYKASGWSLLGDEPGTTYRYLDGRYVTDRQLAALLGKHDDRTYRALLGNRFRVSEMALAPLLVFHRRLDAIDG